MILNNVDKNVLYIIPETCIRGELIIIRGISGGTPYIQRGKVGVKTSGELTSIAKDFLNRTCESYDKNIVLKGNFTIYKFKDDHVIKINENLFITIVNGKIEKINKYVGDIKHYNFIGVKKILVFKSDNIYFKNHIKKTI